MDNFKLKISINAELHLRELYLDGYLRWGAEQADLYYDNLICHFTLLQQSPQLFTRVDGIRRGYRRSICGKHAIYYRLNGDTVEIMAILKKQNPVTQL